MLDHQPTHSEENQQEQHHAHRERYNSHGLREIEENARAQQEDFHDEEREDKKAERRPGSADDIRSYGSKGGMKGCWFIRLRAIGLALVQPLNDLPFANERSV